MMYCSVALVFLPFHKLNAPAMLLLIAGNLKYDILFITCFMRIGQLAQKLKGGHTIHTPTAWWSCKPTLFF